MKLYATVTSERASKGQGGNSHIDIDITVDDKLQEKACKIVVSYDKHEGIDIYYVDYYEPDAEYGTNLLTLEKRNGKLVLQGSEDIKGEKQKGECYYATEDTNFCETHNVEH